MRDLIKKKLSEIGDEVNELHPLLEVVFYQLPNVRHVRHTHGVDEMGADFVLTKRDETFGNDEYIGVVVKKGAIKQNNLPGIEKQIDECELPRLTEDGKKKISLTEIWIVSNENISRNAKEVIYHKYKLRNIKFVPGNQLVRWIEEYAPNYWLDVPLGIGQYLTEIRKTNAEIEQKSSLLPVAKKALYIEQKLKKIENKKYESKEKHNKKQAIDFVDLINKESFVIVEGPMGMGKTRYLRKIVEYYAIPENYVQHKLLPLPISYKDLSEEYNSNILQFIRSIEDECKIEKDQVNYLTLMAS